FCDGTPDILAYPENRAGWGFLCRLLTRGNLRAEKGDCILYLDDLLEHAHGLQLLVMEGSTCGAPPVLHSSFRDPAQRRTRNPCPPAEIMDSGPRAKAHAQNDDKTKQFLLRLREAAPHRVRLAAAMLYRGNDRARLAARAALARDLQLPLIAVNDVLYHHSDRRRLADVLTCIREHTTIDKAGRILAPTAERYLN